MPAEIKIYLEDANQAYSTGVWYLLEEIFTENMGMLLKRIDGVSATVALRDADIYVTPFSAGIDRICAYMFSRHKKNFLLIGISIGQNLPIIENLHHCLQSVFIRRTDSVEQVRHKVSQAWTMSNEKKEEKCRSCRRLLLTAGEKRVIYYLDKGFSVSQIGNILGIGMKMASQRKRKVMRKYNLHSDVELWNFLNKWREYLIPAE
ncbi:MULTISPECIES: helix-turn-helix transcriptional regulator [Hafniaceae]|uniref:helix-turn-helix transcriptional regulator n=1 Tax=Hafniaceae TaxID=1903412 RepID=UPI001D113429|nr:MULTISPECIES: LuxR C-terminal-related transcriptional regulator [Hafniaceae]